MKLVKIKNLKFKRTYVYVYICVYIRYVYVCTLNVKGSLLQSNVCTSIYTTIYTYTYIYIVSRHIYNDTHILLLDVCLPRLRNPSELHVHRFTRTETTYVTLNNVTSTTKSSALNHQ